MSKRLERLYKRVSEIEESLWKLPRLHGKVASMETNLINLDTSIDKLRGYMRNTDRLEADLAELIRHEAEGLFMPNEIWWEKKIFLAANLATAHIDYTTFSDYLVKKFKATNAELKEWTLLTAITQS